MKTGALRSLGLIGLACWREVIGSETYRCETGWSREQIFRACSCYAFADWAFCKHLVGDRTYRKQPRVGGSGACFRPLHQNP